MKVLEVAELPPGTMRCVRHRRQRIAVYRVGEAVYATDDTCTHAEASLTEGELDGHVVTCPAHGARFDVRSGEVLAPPAVTPVATYPVRIEDGAIWIEL